MRRREMAGCGHPLPFAAAAGLALGLALFAHQLLLTLAAVVIGPLPAVQTALYLSRKDLSENAAQAASEPAQETQAEPAQELPPCLPVTLKPTLSRWKAMRPARREPVPSWKRTIRRAAGRNTFPAAAAASRTTPASPAPTLPPRSPTRSPLRGVEQPRPADPHHAHPCH